MHYIMIYAELIAVFIFTFFFSFNACGQLFKPLGLGIGTPEEMVSEYQPQIHIEDNVLYACTRQGLYSKDLTNEGSDWQVIGFEGFPIHDYVRRGNDIFALCFDGQKDILFLSHDGGKTYEDATPDAFKKYINECGHVFWYFDRHPTDPNTFLLTSFTHAGISLTNDFGKTWKRITDYTPDYMGFHPLSPNIIYECGGGGYTAELTDFRISYDNGQTWQAKADCFSDYGSIYRLGFHPTDPNKWIGGGNRCVYTTNDNGQTWQTQYLHGDNTPDDYERYATSWRYVTYDNKNSEVIYMVGSDISTYLKIICSTDGGKTWRKPCVQPIQSAPYERVFDLKLHGDKLYVYTQADVYVVSKAELFEQATSVRNITATKRKTTSGVYNLQGIRTNASVRGIYIEDGKKKVLTK